MHSGIKTIAVGVLLLSFSAFAYVPKDEQFRDQWYLHYQKNSLGLDAVRAWDITKGSEKIIVAVIDTGVDYNHPDIKNNIWINRREIINGLDDDQNGYVDDTIGYNFDEMNNDPMDHHGHGTHVAGIIGASHNGFGTVGVMANVQIMAIKIRNQKGADSFARVAKGIEYAVRNGANVINLSLGDSRSYTSVYNALLEAHKNNVIVVAASGNSSTDKPFFPASHDLPNIISVASIDASNYMSSFSNYGNDHVHVFGPGSDILSLRNGGSYTVKSGTSMAAPAVAGVVGLVLSYHGRSAARNMCERLMYTSRKLKRLDGLVSSKGVVNAPNAILGQMSLDLLVD